MIVQAGFKLKINIMNGFDPLGGLQEWHVFTVLILAAAGAIYGIVKLVQGIIWLFTHVQIT